MLGHISCVQHVYWQLLKVSSVKSPQIAELTIKLKDKEHQLAVTTKSASKLGEERENEREQLLNRIEVLREELMRVQEKQDEV